MRRVDGMSRAAQRPSDPSASACEGGGRKRGARASARYGLFANSQLSITALCAGAFCAWAL